MRPARACGSGEAHVEAAAGGARCLSRTVGAVRGPRRLRALGASRGRVSAAEPAGASDPSAAAHWPQHAFRALPPPPDLLDAAAGNAGGQAPELRGGRGWSQSRREARDSLLRRREVWSGAEAPAARWLPIKPGRPLGSSGRSANSWWRVSFRCFLRDKLKLYVGLSGEGQSLRVCSWSASRFPRGCPPSSTRS